MAEQFTFHEMFGQGSAIDGNKGHGCPLALFVQRSGDHLLSCSRFTKNEDGRICRRHFLNESGDLGHGAGGADETYPSLGCLQSALECEITIEQLSLVINPTQNDLEFGHFAGFGEIVERTVSHRFDGCIDRGVTGQQDHLGFGRYFLDSFESVDTGQTGHSDVEDSDIKHRFLDRRHRCPTVFADDNLMPEAGELQTHQFAQRCFVVSKENAELSTHGFSHLLLP